MLARLIISLLMFINVSLFAQKLTIGTTSYAPPFEMTTGVNQFFGFDIDLMNEVCRQLQAECAYVAYPWEMLFSKVTEGAVDLAIAAISITETREERYAFSLPYLIGKAQFMVLSTSPLRLVKELRYKRVGTLKGSLYKVLLKQLFLNEVKVIEYSNALQVYNSLIDKKTDAILGIEPTITYWIANNASLFKPLGNAFLIGSGLGIMGSKDKPVLMDAVNKALVEIEKEGIYERIYNRYFGGF